jgi:TrmH family RNA methyltransferase
LGRVITSSQNPKLKLARALLGRSKERREAGAFVAEGIRLLEEALAVNWPVRFILYTDGLSQRGQVLVKGFKDRGQDIEEVSSDLLQAISETETTQGIIAVLEDHSLPLPATLDFVLIPDQIRDPGNLGTLIRSAAAAGVQALFIPSYTADAFAPKVVRSAMGAHFRLPFRSMSWEEIHQATSSSISHIYLADMQGEPCWEADLRAPLALIIGSEAEGASAEALALTPHRLSIPMPGAVESLNAGVAGSILMFEVVRQRTLRADA